MNIKTLAYIIFIIFFLSACSDNSPRGNKHKVFIQKKDGKYTLYRLGKPYIIKGAAGFNNLEALSASGGNTIRIWDTTNVDAILKEANKNHLSVIIGLPMPDSKYIAFYNDTSRVAKQHKLFKTFVNKYKHNPAVLMWCVGNELAFPYKPTFGSFYTEFNNIVQMIHHDDPDHPVTTTVVNFQQKDIINISLRTDIDLISFNVFGRLKYLRDDLRNFSWFWRGPYMITEWGIDGPWEGTAQTAWGAYIETNSTNKAEQYRERYKRQMPVEDPRFLGSFIFYWGQKQETTPTWFSLFDNSGAKSEVVDAARYIWTGTPPANQAPQIKHMLVDGNGAIANLMYKPGDKANAEVFMLKPDPNITSVQWQIFKEDWYHKNNLNSTQKTLPLSGMIFDINGLKATFVTPEKPGPYRLFATIYDKFGNIATCNTPFYVIANDVE